VSVIEEGEIGTGDEIEVLSRDENKVTVADVVRLYLRQSGDGELIARASRLNALPESWREHFRRQLGKS